MSLAQRSPCWNGTATRWLAAAARGASPSWKLDETACMRLGLRSPPRDPALLAEFLVADDAADAAHQADDFARGIRRAVRLGLALSAGLHRRARQPWKQWVEAHFQVGYACFHRYRVAAELQLGLLARGLPLLTNEHQSRTLAPWRRHEHFWAALAEFRDGLPPAADLKVHLTRALGGGGETNVAPRLQLHRALQRLLAAAPADPDEPAVAEALTLLHRALRLLEAGHP